MLILRRMGIAALVFGVLGACASDASRDGFAASDPFEETNRVIHAGNLRTDRYVVRPLAEGYDLVTPTLVKHLIGNGFSHLDTVNDFANYVLQADVDRSLNALGRFTINTIVGAGGLLDPATEFGLAKDGTDFGLTLGVHGLGEGPYLVLPLLGPSNARDLGGFLVDRVLSPTIALGPLDAPGYVGPALTGVELLDRRDRNADLIDEVFYNSADSYVTLRAAYLQRRRSQIAGDEGVEDTLPDIFDDEEITQ